MKKLQRQRNHLHQAMFCLVNIHGDSELLSSPLMILSKTVENVHCSSTRTYDHGFSKSPCNIIQDDINAGILTCLLCHGFSLVKAAISPQIVHLPRTMDQVIAPRVAGFPTPTLDIVKIVLWRNNGGSKLMFVCFHRVVR